MTRICEKCLRDHEGAYGSGRFCSSGCARAFSTKAKRSEINAKVSGRLKGIVPKSVLVKGDPRLVTIIAKTKARASLRKTARLRTQRLGVDSLSKIRDGQKRGNDTYRLRRLRFLMESPWESLSNKLRFKRVKTEQNWKCLRCGLGDWNGEPLVIEVDHIDGVKSNNSRANLRGLCPNCHSQTPTWKGKNTAQARRGKRGSVE